MVFDGAGIEQGRLVEIDHVVDHVRDIEPVRVHHVDDLIHVALLKALEELSGQLRAGRKYLLWLGLGDGGLGCLNKLAFLGAGFLLARRD